MAKKKTTAVPEKESIEDFYKRAGIEEDGVFEFADTKILRKIKEKIFGLGGISVGFGTISILATLASTALFFAILWASSFLPALYGHIGCLIMIAATIIAIVISENLRNHSYQEINETFSIFMSFVGMAYIIFSLVFLMVYAHNRGRLDFSFDYYNYIFLADLAASAFLSVVSYRKWKKDGWKEKSKKVEMTHIIALSVIQSAAFITLLYKWIAIIS